MLLHLHGTKVDFKPSIIPNIQIDTPEFTDLLVTAYERELSKENWASLKGRNAADAFDNLMLKVALTAARFNGAKVAILNNTRRKEGTDPWGANIRGSLRIKTTHLETALRRSDAYGIIVLTFGTDGRKVAKFPEDTDSKHATAASKQLGALSFGLVPCGTGYSIRAKPEDVEAVEAQVNAEVAALCSSELLHAKHDQGQYYIIKLVPKGFTDVQLCEALKDNLAWESRLHRVLTRHREYDDHEVFAIPLRMSSREFMMLGTE